MQYINAVMQYLKETTTMNPYEQPAKLLASTYNTHFKLQELLYSRTGLAVIMSWAASDILCED